METQVTELRVLPHQYSGGWLVEADEEHRALSWHGTATEAERAARRYAQARGARSITVRDRYARVHSLPAQAPVRGARARHSPSG